MMHKSTADVFWSKFSDTFGIFSPIFSLEIYIEINLQHLFKDTGQDVSELGEQT